ncbi:MAG: hypothetical protein ACYC4L_22055 [Chloroflexota bacterium]
MGKRQGVWLLVLLPLLAVPLVGFWALGYALLLAVPAWRYGARPAPRATALGAVMAGLLGGAAGLGSAALALGTLAGREPYVLRAPLGWLALLLALAATVGALIAPLRPGLAAALMLLGALAGTLAISLFYVETLYPLATVLWLLGATFALLSRSNK